MQNKFKDIFKGKVVIIGVGNVLRGDDGFGPALIKSLQDSVPAVLIDTASTPENYIGKIAREKPETILIADVMHLGGAAGQYGLFPPEEVAKGGFSTHDISPRMFIDLLRRQTEAAIYFLGVQPKNINLGNFISEEVEAAIGRISALIKEAFTCMKHT